MMFSPARSGDGRYQLSLSAGGYMFLSSDWGATWTQLSITGAKDCAISETGQYMYVAPSYGSLMYSTNYGATWASRSGTYTFLSVATSADGTKVLASTSSGLFWSVDRGATISIDSSFAGFNSALSYDGQYRFVVMGGEASGYLAISNNGAAWNYPSSGLNGNETLHSSRTGQYLLMMPLPGYGTPRKSSNYGSSFQYAQVSQGWLGGDISPDGDIIVCLATTSAASVVSRDFGATWSTITDFIKVKVSDNVIMAGGNNGLYESYDKGVTFTQVRSVGNYNAIGLSK